MNSNLLNKSSKYIVRMPLGSHFLFRIRFPDFHSQYPVYCLPITGKTTGDDNYAEYGAGNSQLAAHTEAR
jgi:hypothetical protein